MTQAQRKLLEQIKKITVYRTDDFRKKRSLIALENLGLITLEIKCEGEINKFYWLEAKRMNYHEKAVEIFEKMGHLITQEDVVLTTESIIDFETHVGEWETREIRMVDDCRTTEFTNGRHASGKRFDYFVLIDLGMRRAVWFD